MFVLANDVIEVLKPTKNLHKAIICCRTELHEFCRLVDNHDPRIHSRFYAVALEPRDGRWVPFGIEAERIEGENVLGKAVYNLREDNRGEPIAIPLDTIVDISYIELGELKLGFLYKEVYKLASQGIRSAINGPKRKAIIEENRLLTSHHRQLLRDVITENEDAIIAFRGNPELVDARLSLAHVPYSEISHASILEAPLGEFIARYASGTFIDRLIEGEMLNPQRHSELLCEAARSGNSEAVSAFAKNGWAVDCECVSGSPLSNAVDFDRFQAAKVLLEHSANPNSVDYNGATPLFCAKSVSMMKLLVEYGANIDHEVDGVSCLTQFLEQRKLMLVHALLEMGATVPPDTVIDDEDARSVADLGRDLADKSALEEEAPIDRRDYFQARSVDYGAVLPLRSIDSKSGQIEW